MLSGLTSLVHKKRKIAMVARKVEHAETLAAVLKTRIFSTYNADAALLLDILEAGGVSCGLEVGRYLGPETLSGFIGGYYAEAAIGIGSNRLGGHTIFFIFCHTPERPHRLWATFDESNEVLQVHAPCLNGGRSFFSAEFRSGENK